MNAQQQQEPAQVINFSPSQPHHCVFCGELLGEDTEGPFDSDCEETRNTVLALDRMIGDEPMLEEFQTAISNAGILLTGKDGSVEDTLECIMLGLSQGLDGPEQRMALSALQYLGFRATASLIGSALCVDGFSASKDPAFLTLEDGELRLSCEPRKKASKLLREDLGGEWIDTDRIFAFAPEPTTAHELLRVCASWYPLVQFNNEFLVLVEGDEDEPFGEEETEAPEEANPELEAFGEGIKEGLEDGHPAVDAAMEEEMVPAEELDEDLFMQALANMEKPLNRKAFQELVDMSSKYDLALAELAPEDIEDPHLARLWEVYMASVGTALVADAAIDQYLADRKAFAKKKSRKS